MIKLDHLTLAVRDAGAARDWYRSHLGLKVEFEIPERGVVAMQDDAGFTVFLDERSEAIGGGVEQLAVSPAAYILYFQVDDVDAIHGHLAARGVRIVHSPRKEPWGYGLEIADRDGHRVRLWDQRSMATHGG